MANITPLKHTPHTRIENSIIDDNLPQIGVYGFTIYVVLRRHLNQKTNQCNPSYSTIARKIGIDRSTVIRYVNKLKGLGLISPSLRFKEDGSQSSNQYNFSSATAGQDSMNKGNSTEPLPVVAPDNQPSSPPPPEQSSSQNKKERTITEVDFSPTEKQKTCQHPTSEIVILPDVTICHHCYGLLDENLQLVSEEKTVENVCAA